MRKLLQEKGSVFKKIMSWILVMVILFTSADMSAFVVSAENQEAGLLSDGASDSGGDLLTDGAAESLPEQVPTEQPPAEQLPTEEPPIQDNIGGENETGYLTVKIFEDENKNGAWDEGETGISDLEVMLSLKDTEENIPIQASGAGVYAIDGIQEGIYTVRLSAAPEVAALYNLTESVLLSPDGNNIFYPNAEDTWFIGWNNIDITKNHELVLGLQKDDLEKIEEEIGDVADGELLETEEGVFFASEAATKGITANGFLKREYIYYKGYQVDVWFDNGNSAGFSGCPSYRWIFRASDNKILYCIEPFVNGIDKGNYKGGGNMANAYGADKARYMQLCAYYGADYAWPGVSSDWSVKALYFMAAQNLIWKQMGAQHLQWYQYKGDYHGHFHPGYAIDISYYENQIINKINNHSKMPSLPANQKIDHDYDNPDKVYSFTDKNGALGNGWQSSSYHTEGWWIKSVPAGVNKAWIEGNQLKFTLKKDASIDGKQITFPLEKWFSSRGSNQYYVSTNPRQQSLMYQGSVANIPYNWSVTVNPTGQAKIQKVDDTGNPVSGVSFKWGTDKNNLNHTTGKTGSDGTVTIQANTGTIYVQEHEVPSNLIKDETIKSVQIQSGKTASLTFTNQRVTRNVSIRKIETSTGVPIAGAKFQYWNEERPETKYTATTDSKGEFISSVKFPVGSRVTMEEIEAAPGYELPSESERKQTITISLNESENKFTFKNTVKKIPVKLKKVNERTGEPIQGGVTFKIGQNLNDSRMYEVLTTGSDGTVTTKEYRHGTELFYQEIEAPSGFQVDDTIYSVIVDASTSSEVQTVTVRNEEAPIRFSIKKKGDDGRPLAGVRFRLEKKTGSNWYTIHSNLVTDKNGELDIPGTYDRELVIDGRLRLIEEETVPGYDLLEEPFVFKEEHLDSEEAHAEITIINKKIPTRLVIKKKDKDTDVPLAGAVFTVHQKENGQQVGDKLVTGSDGTVSMNLPYGEYYVKEVSFPSGYASASGKTYPFTLDGTHIEVTQTVPNTKSEYALRLFKTDGETGEFLSGAVFGLYEDNADLKVDEPIQKFTTNANGSAVVFLAEGGHYDIYELQAPAGYERLTEKFEVYVDDETPTVEITVENAKQSLEIEIHKTDETNQPLSGAVFEIRNAKTGALVAKTEPTDSTGKVMVQVPAGDYEYTVTEIQAPDGYVLDSTPKPVMINKENQGGEIIYTAQPVEITNRQMKGNIKLVKVDGESQKPLEGAVFGVYDSNGDLVDTLTTNSNGEAMSKNLPNGKYTLKELTPPLGYESFEMTYEAELTETEQLITITAENIPLKGGFTVEKKDAQSPETALSGAVFRVYISYEDAANNENYIAEKTTEDNGLAVFENLSYGTYYVKETKAPEDYELNTRIFTVTVDGESAENLVLEVENHKKLEKGIFRVKKTDADTGAALKGAEFLVEGKDYSHTYVTGENGTFETEELIPGTYTVTETKAPEGYRISENPTRTVAVKAGDGIVSSSPVVEYEFTNEKIQFPIRIVKTDDTSENKPLAGAVFELYRLNEQGDREGEALETLVTDINGEAISKMLTVGSYEVVEVTPPEGYKLSEYPSQTVEITEDTPPETLEFEVIFRNSPELGSLKILKLGLPDKEAEETLGNPLAGAEFEVTGISSGQVYRETSNSEGIAEFKNLPFGIYNVREVKVPDGYEDDSAYFGTVEVGKETPVVEITAYNYKKYGALSLKKTDSETGNLVAGAVYGIYTRLAENGEVDPESYLGKEYDLITSSDQAYVTSKQLELGTYYIKEIASPSGYKLNPTVYTATITDEIPVVQIDAVDEPYKGSVSIHKTDETGKPLEGAVFALYTKEDYDKLEEDLEPGEHFPDVPVSYLTTDSQGNAGKEDLVLGQEYVLIEFAAPAGYELQFEKQVFTPSAEKMDFEYQAVNKKKKELIIHKVNENGDPVSDVMFSVYRFGPDGRPETSDDGEAVAVLSPGITGDGIARMDISHLENGWYYVKETQGSEMGYEVSQEIITFEITDEKKEYEFTFVNYRPKGEIEIQKKDELGNPLPGAEFTLNIPGPDWYNGTNPDDLEEVAKFELDENGYGILKDIEASVYVIRETKAPEGYKPAEDILVVMHRDGTEDIKNDRVYYYYHADIVNKPITGWISIQKQADLDDEPVTNMDLSNARFEIRDAKGELADTLITAKDGTAVSRELPVGTYTIKETQAPQGTILNEAEKTITIDGTGENDIYTYTHVNQVVKGRIQLKKTDGDNPEMTLAGAEFDILREDGTVADHLVTDKAGIATSDYLPYGWYTIRETKAPSGYALQIRDIRCLIQKEDQLIELTVENIKSEDAEVLVVKYDKDNPEHYLKGAEFKLYENEELSQQIGETFTTDDKGRIYFSKELNLEKGKTYYLQETKAPDGYVLDETVHSFILDTEKPQSVALYIPNEQGKGYIRFDKTGEMLTGMEDDETYPGLKKLIWKEQTLTDAEIGIYAKTPVTLDGRTYQKGELIQRLKSGETSRALPLGTYEYKELSAPDGYILDPKPHDIEVKENNVTEADAALAALKNDHASVSMELHKKFKDGNTPEKLEQVVFGVYTAYEVTENNVTIPAETLLGILRIDETGQSIENDLKLPEGMYYVMELETADGYVLDGHKYPFTTGYQNEDRVIEISSAENPIINEPVYGTIRVEKTGDMFTKVEKLVNQEGKYQVNRPVYGKGELKGAEFEIRAKDKVIVDGEPFEPGEVIDTLITGEKDESIKLPLGTYILVETKAPDGYILNDKPEKVTILPNEEPAKPSVAVHTMENEKAVPEITLYKSFFGKTPEEAAELYKEVLFGVYAQEEIRGVTNEAVLKADELVGLIRINETGKGILKEDTVLPFGKYYVKELETAEGYQVSEEEYSFEVTKDNVGTEPVLIPGIAEDTPVVNLPEGAEIPFAFRKIGEDGKPLEGAVFRLYTCNEEHEHSQEAGTEGSCWKEVYGLSPKTSGADGIVDFGILPDGTYQLKETEAPEGYVLPAGQWRFTVNSEAIPGEHITFTPTGGAQPPAFQKPEEDAVYQYQVMNRKARQMPFTGGTGMLDYAAGGGVLLALAELVNRRRKKKNKGNVQ